MSLQRKGPYLFKSDACRIPSTRITSVPLVLISYGNFDDIGLNEATLTFSATPGPGAIGNTVQR